MADFFSRLAERALGVAAVARPWTPPAFAPTPQAAVDAFTPAPSSAIPPAPEPRPEPEAAPRVLKTEQATDTKDLPFAPRGKTPELRKTGEEVYPATKKQALRSRIGPASPPVSPQDLEPDSRPLEKPAAGQRIGAATESRSPTVASPSRRPSAETSARDPPARSINPGGRDDEAAATSVDAPLWMQPATPALLFAPRTSAQTATPERERVRSYEQSDSAVQVNIGRIEVRAVFPEPLTSSPVRRAADSALSLADYLKERDRGAR